MRRARSSAAPAVYNSTYERRIAALENQLAQERAVSNRWLDEAKRREEQVRSMRMKVASRSQADKEKIRQLEQDLTLANAQRQQSSAAHPLTQIAG
ncbi:hypothetical protein NMY22_g7368 [Coprinellus aureogranulatus]|nr:hypothetical protein NMY22_g7368 [Coprinellus aureogranulatus]